jgi:hypothetical protein
VWSLCPRSEAVPSLILTAHLSSATTALTDSLGAAAWTDWSWSHQQGGSRGTGTQAHRVRSEVVRAVRGQQSHRRCVFLISHDKQ